MEGRHGTEFIAPDKDDKQHQDGKCTQKDKEDDPKQMHAGFFSRPKIMVFSSVHKFFCIFASYVY